MGKSTDVITILQDIAKRHPNLDYQIQHGNIPQKLYSGEVITPTGEHVFL